MQLRRLLLLFLLPSALSTLMLGFAACGGDDDAGQPATTPTNKDGATDGTAFLPEVTTPPTPDAEPPPGNVCGDPGGLEPGSPWPLRGGCPTRAGWSALSGPQNASVRSITPLHAGDTSPAIEPTKSVVWVGTTEGDIVAVVSGAPRWALRTGGAVRSSPALDKGGNAIAGSTDGNLYGVNVGSFAIEDAGADGGIYPPAKLVFALPVGKIASSPVIGADGTIYVGTLEGKLVAVQPSGSATKWSVTTNDTNGSSPALGQDGTIYVGSSDHKLYAFTSLGAPKWSTDLGAEIKGSPAVGGDGTIYIGGVDGKLHAIDPSGKERWNYATGGPIHGTPAVYAGAVYVGSEDRKLHAVNTVGGSKRWIYDTLGAVGTPVIGPDGLVYVGSSDGHVYAITEKGSLFFAWTVKGKVTNGGAIGTSTELYITTDNGLVLISP